MEFTLELMPTSVAVAKDSPIVIMQNIIAAPIATWIESNIHFNEGWLLEATMSYLTSFNQYADIIGVSRKLLNNATVVHVAGDKAGSGTIKFDQTSGWEKDPFHYDNLFRGKMFTLMKVLMFAVEVNYPDFFGKVSMYAEMLKGYMETEKEKIRQLDESFQKENLESESNE